ncbi:hypothetical protein PHABIO_21 [Pseudomonas phage Phabio]|uniref:Uncharacterized protein n=1 Tax=Pseudomonas phage Phabio TaxID=2006668 RepID=A0A1Y0ST63_9CAUD|nr:hypothetical protein MZD05_gp021 [Pseudomonas phage Phabio]ARV76652.1 hypothetical protein PHABIO_21 [Pseudomonas phage Phabio]
MAIRPSAFPLNNADQGSIDSRTSADQLAARYKNMLGFQAAGPNIGLFYQLERNAAETEASKDQKLSKYDGYNGPVEAGGIYT